MCLQRRAMALLVVLAWTVPANGVGLPSPRAPALRSAPVSQRAANTGSIGGTIVSTVDRSPLPRARVLLTASVLGAPRVAISGPDGRYRFDRLPPASYGLSVMRGGYVAREYGERRSAPADVISLSEGQRLDGIDVALAPAGVIAGVILDEDGKPFGGAAVEALISRAEGNTPALAAIATARSDDRGAFRLAGLPAGEYYVSAFDPAFTNAGDETGPLHYSPTYFPGVAFTEDATRVAVKPGVEPPVITFGLKIVRPARVSGTMGTQNGRPLLSAAISMAQMHTAGLTVIPTRDVTIAPDGSFEFRDVPPGRFQLRARGEVDPHDVALFATYNAVVDGRDLTNISMTLVPGAHVTGVVITEDGRPVKAASFTGLRVRAPFSDGSLFGDAVTGEVQPDGTYGIRGLMAGHHVFVLEGLREPWLVKRIMYRGQDITDSGLDADSARRFDDVRITVTSTASELSGTVRDDKGEPVADATVLIVPLAEQYWTRTSRRFGLQRTGADGRYRLRGLPAGEYRAIASVELDEADAYRASLLRRVSETGVAVSLENLEQRVLDLSLTASPGPRTASSR